MLQLTYLNLQRLIGLAEDELELVQTIHHSKILEENRKFDKALQDIENSSIFICFLRSIHKNKFSQRFRCFQDHP